MRIRIWMAIAAVVASLTLVAACGGGEEADEVYRIGVLDSLTGAGETYGNVALNAKQMAADEINEAGGVDGVRLELVVEDSKCNAADAIAGYRKLTDVEGVRIVLGTSCSAAMLGTAPVAEADGNILFTGMAVHPDIAFAGDYIFRNSINGTKMGTGTGNLIWEDGNRTLATLTESTDYAEGARLTTTDQFTARGGAVLAEERYPTDTTDFRTPLTKLLDTNPDAVAIAAQAEFSGGTAIKQLRELGYDGPIYGEVVSLGATALEIAGDAATGARAVISYPDFENPTAARVIRDFRERYQYITLAWYIGAVYDGVNIVAECLKQTRDDQDADGMRDCLYATEHTGALGDGYRFDEQGEVIGLSPTVVEVLPQGERNDDNQGFRSLGFADSE